MTQQDESANFFRLVRALVDEGSDVLRDVLLTRIQPPDTLEIILQRNEKTIKQNRFLSRDQSNLLTKLPAVKPKELDITLLCWIFTNICNIAPTNGWQTPPGATDLSLGDDIYRLRSFRNKIFAHTNTTRVTTADFETLWSELKTLIIRLAKHGTPQRSISVRISRIRFEDQYPESQTKKSVELLYKWMKQDDEKIEIIYKRTEEHGDQLAKQEMRFVNHDQRLERHDHQLEKHQKHLEDQQHQLKQQGHLLKQSQSTSSMTEDEHLSDELLLESWLDDDKYFVETRASEYVDNEILKTHSLTVVGNSGSGKTAIARHCALKLKQLGYSIVPITRVKDILASSSKRNLKQVYLWDDPVGTEGLDSIQLAKIESYNDKIIQLLTKTNRKVLITCRTQIVQDPLFQVSSSFIKTHIIDLHENTLQLTEAEMSAILSKHAENLKPSETRNIPLKEIKCFNFPLLCKLYAGNEQYREKGKNFFLNPYPVVVKEIKKLKPKDKLKYCALALCLLHDNKLECQVFNVFPSATADNPKIRQLMEACGLPRDTPVKDVERATQSLVGVYLIKVETVYSFIHETLFEATAYSFGVEYPLEVLKHCTSAFIRKYVRLSPSSEGYFISLGPHCYNELCQRLIKDIEDGNFHDIFMGQLFKHDEFLIYFSDHLKNLENSKITKLFLETDVNLEKYPSDQTETSVNIGSINLIRNSILSDPRVKCIHFLLALGLSSIAKVCLEKLDFSIIQTESLCLLPVACFGGDVEVVDLLTNIIDHCDFNEFWFGKPRDMSTRHMAALSGNTSMMELVIKQSLDRVPSDIVESIPLFKAIADSCTKDGTSPLHMAAEVGHKDIIELLLKYKTNVDLCDKSDVSPLRMAVSNGHKDIVELLLKKEAKVNLCDKDSVYPLYIAALKGDKDIVELLLKYKAKVNVRNKNGSTPLYIAAREGHTDIVELLLKYKANTELCNTNGATTLYMAAREGHKAIVELLLKSEANVDLGQRDGLAPLSGAVLKGDKDLVELLLTYKANADSKDKDGFPPLYVATQNGDKDLVDLLLKYKANADLCDKDGFSPLSVAAQNGDKDIVELLLKSEANVNLCNTDGFSPLYMAAREGYKDIAELLLKYNAHVDDKDDFSPLFVAAQNGHTDIVELLRMYKKM